jgi:hypothetical protein
MRTALQLLNFCLLPEEIEATKCHFRESVKGEEFFFVDPSAEAEFYEPLTSLGYRSDGVILASNGDCLVTITAEDIPPRPIHDPTPPKLFYASIDRKAFTEVILSASQQSTESIDLSTLINASALRLLPENNIFARLDLVDDMQCILREGKRSQQTVTLKTGYLQDICSLAASLGDATELTIFKNQEGASRAVLFSTGSRLLGLIASIRP